MGAKSCEKSSSLKTSVATFLMYPHSGSEKLQPNFSNFAFDNNGALVMSFQTFAFDNNGALVG